MQDLTEIHCLIVDDDPFMLKTLEAQLKHLGVKHVVSSTNARDALKHIANRNNAIDIVFSDLNMPEVDGIQLLQHISGLGLDIVVAVISGEDPRLLETVTSLAEQQHLPVLGALPKPVSTQQLQALLSNYQPPSTSPPSGPAAMVFADELKQAIVNSELCVHFQPQVSLADQRIIGIEALARWQHPVKGFIPPAIFIGIAEKYGMINAVTDTIFQQAISACKGLHDKGLAATLSVNFSALTLNNLELPEVIETTLNAKGFPTKNFIIEITESSLASDSRVALNILARTRLKGIGLSIDDFGTGFSSLEQLKHIPFTELKIDRSFVHQASKNSASYAILESSIELAKKLNIHSIAEGVETQEDWDVVQSLGCDSAQGYFIAKPMPPDEFMTWAKKFSQQRFKSAQT